MSAALSIAGVSDQQFRRQVSDRLSGLPTSWAQGSAAYSPPSLLNGTETGTTVTVTGATMGSPAMAGFSLDLQGLAISAYVSATNTVAVRLRNGTGGTVSLSSGTLYAYAWVP